MSHPIDVQYDLLSTTINVINESDPVYSFITQSFANTQADYHQGHEFTLKSVFSLYKSSEKLRYLPFEKRMHNKFLLWHGVRQSSLAINLREGLKLPSSDVPQSAFMFGKGIYLHDSSSKAALQSLNPTNQ